jgi:DNA helicase HerA-like ATPase
LSSNDVVKVLEERLNDAIKLADKLGRIVGYVSRTSPSYIDEEGGYVVFDVDPVVYFENYDLIAQAGSLLGVIDIKTLNVISLKVVSVERRDVLAELDLPDMYFPIPHAEASGLLTKTRIKAKPLLAYDTKTGDVRVANIVIEPQSPVVLLTDPEVIQQVLGLPTEGVFLGYSTVGDTPLFGGNAPLLLPLRAFYQHVLVLGTTGSGKTTLLKNMIASMHSGYKLIGERPSIVIFDPNKDYVTIPLEPPWLFTGGVSEDESRLAKKVLDQINRLDGVVIILPVTRSVVDEYIDKYESWARILKAIAEDYIKGVINPITSKFGWSGEIAEIEVVQEPGKTTPLRFVRAKVKINFGYTTRDAYYYVIPYALRFHDFTPKELVALNPYFTRQAKDALQRILQALSAKGVVIETIYDLYEAIKEARFRIEERITKPRGVVLDPNREYVIQIIRDLAIHKSTLENMIRQIASIIDTGIFDVYTKGVGEDKYLYEPPIGEILDKHFQLFNGYPIVVDLEFLQLHSMADPEKTISIVAFRILNKIFEWKLIESRYKMSSQPVLIFIDEAHRFFPSRGGVEEYIENVSAMIDRIARLGRARKLGLVFSTHSPRDVHDIILQLTNTKIILRTDKSHLGVLDLPEEYREFITRAGDRVGVVKSHVLRLGYSTFKTPLPLLGHYDLSVTP